VKILAIEKIYFTSIWLVGMPRSSLPTLQLSKFYDFPCATKSKQHLQLFASIGY
jgi:hypothetical protein